MSDSVNPLAGSENAQAQAVQAQTVESAQNPAGLNASTMVPNNVASIPSEVKDAMMKGIAMAIIGDMRRSNDRYRETMRKARHQR